MTVSFTSESLSLRITDRDNRWESQNWRAGILADGRFEGTGLKGQFYGPNHDEAGGAFWRLAIENLISPTYNRSVEGVFSVKRQ